VLVELHLRVEHLLADAHIQRARACVHAPSLSVALFAAPGAPPAVALRA
jgi:hypothetical protein